MPREDQLNRDERIRLEALAQANMYAGRHMDQFTPHEVINNARVFEVYIRGLGNWDTVENLDVAQKTRMTSNG